MENYNKSCNICSIKLTVDNKAKRNQRCLECHSNIEKERGKIYREAHREENKEKCKQYRKAHLEERKAYTKEYNEVHKEEIKAKKSEKIECECGEMICKSSKAKHKISSGHQAFLKYGDASKAEPNYYNTVIKPQKERMRLFKAKYNITELSDTCHM